MIINQETLFQVQLTRNGSWDGAPLHKSWTTTTQWKVEMVALKSQQGVFPFPCSMSVNPIAVYGKLSDC